MKRIKAIVITENTQARNTNQNNGGFEAGGPIGTCASECIYTYTACAYLRTYA